MHSATHVWLVAAASLVVVGARDVGVAAVVVVVVVLSGVSLLYHAAVST